MQVIGSLSTRHAFVASGPEHAIQALIGSGKALSLRFGLDEADLIKEAAVATKINLDAL